MLKLWLISYILSLIVFVLNAHVVNHPFKICLNLIKVVSLREDCDLEVMLFEQGLIGFSEAFG